MGPRNPRDGEPLDPIEARTLQEEGEDFEIDKLVEVEMAKTSDEADELEI